MRSLAPLVFAAALLSACSRTPESIAPSTGILPTPESGAAPVTVTRAQSTVPPTVETVTGTATSVAPEPTPTTILSATALSTPGGQSTPTAGDASAITEVDVRELPLGPPLDDANAEISGMAWEGDRLILLPQYPGRYGGVLFGFERADVLAQIEPGNAAPLNPVAVPFDDGGLAGSIRGFEGFEALAFSEERFFMTVEARLGATTMTGYLVSGTVEQDGTMRLNPETLTELPAAAALENYSDEAITVAHDSVLTFYEANGANVNPDAIARRFDSRTLAPLDSLPLETVEYRLTDATPVDARNRFWVINTLFPGDIPKLRPANDAFEMRFGEGESHARNPGVERLIELEITGEGVVATGSTPIYLDLDLGRPRNWEGIVRIEDHGFLLVTDKFPDTLLGFVPYPR